MKDDGERHSRRVALVVATCLGLTVLGAPRAARASDAALAEELYELGRKLMAEGHIAEACPRFAESERLDPATGTLLNLATCHEAEGKLATAWAEFRAAETAARHDGREDRERYAYEHIAGIEPRLSYLRVVVDPASHVEGLEVKLDASTLGEASWGVAAPVDPGPHEVTARAPGRAPFFERVLVTASPRRITVSVALPLEGAPAAPTAHDVAPTSSAVAPSSSHARVAGKVALGVSAAALIVGVTFGVRAQAKWDARNSAAGMCGPDDACSAVGVQYGDQAQTAAHLADVAFAVGVVGLGTAAYFLLLHHEAPAPTSARLNLAPAVSASAGGVALTGTW